MVLIITRRSCAQPCPGGQCDVTDAVPASPHLASVLEVLEVLKVLSPASCLNIITAPQGVGLPYFSPVRRLLSSAGNKYQCSRIKHTVWVTMRAANCAVNLVCSFLVSRHVRGKQTVLTMLSVIADIMCRNTKNNSPPPKKIQDLIWLQFSGHDYIFQRLADRSSSSGICVSVFLF